MDILWFVSILYSRISYHTVVKFPNFKEIELTKDFPNFGPILMLALFIWTLAHIFEKELDLQEEKDLTIKTMAIIANLDVMLARRKVSLTELSERVKITMSNLSILKKGKANKELTGKSLDNNNCN